MVVDAAAGELIPVKISDLNQLIALTGLPGFLAIFALFILCIVLWLHRKELTCIKDSFIVMTRELAQLNANLGRLVDREELKKEIAEQVREERAKDLLIAQAKNTKAAL